MSTYVYLDYAAATPLSDAALEAMLPYFRDSFYNASALYAPAREIKKVVTQARQDIANLIGAKKTEVVFTAGGSEANSIALGGLLRKYPQAKIMCLSIEHESVSGFAAAEEHIPVQKSGIVDVAQLKKQVGADVVCISAGLINNEIGVIQPLSQIAKVIEEIRVERHSNGNDLPLYLHTDASQAGGVLDLSVGRLGVDLMTINGGKMYGPKQSGCLYIKTGINIDSHIMGGGQEKGLRSGTHNTPSIVGFASAFMNAEASRKENAKRFEQLFAQLIKVVDEVERVSVNGSIKSRSYLNLNLTIDGVSGEDMVLYLENEGFLIGTGAACSANNDTPSHVLMAIGLSREQANSSVRISLGVAVTEDDIENFKAAFKLVVKKLRARS